MLAIHNVHMHTIILYNYTIILYYYPFILYQQNVYIIIVVYYRCIGFKLHKSFTHTYKSDGSSSRLSSAVGVAVADAFFLLILLTTEVRARQLCMNEWWSRDMSCDWSCDRSCDAIIRHWGGGM